MCNCRAEWEERLKDLTPNSESVCLPVEMFTGRLYLMATARINGKKKEKEIPILLSKCPFCGVPYDKDVTP